MRHKVYGKHLGRTKNQRTALFKSLVRSLILHESISTTESKAKAVKGLVDKLVTQAKNKNTQRLISQFLVEKEVAEKLIGDVAPRLKDRSSGYTSIIKLGRRRGDGVMMVQMNLLTGGKPAGKPQEKEEAATEKVQVSKVKEEKASKAEVRKAPVKKAAKKEAK